MEIEKGLKIPVASINLLIKMKEGVSKFRERDKNRSLLANYY